MVSGTITNHLASYIITGEVNIEELLDKEKIDELTKLIKETKFEGLSDFIQKTNRVYSYSEVRMMLNFLNLDK